MSNNSDNEHSQSALQRIVFIYLMVMFTTMSLMRRADLLVSNPGEAVRLILFGSPMDLIMAIVVMRFFPYKWTPELHKLSLSELRWRVGIHSGLRVGAGASLITLLIGL